jgi:hypothetical protein
MDIVTQYLHVDELDLVNCLSWVSNVVFPSVEVVWTSPVIIGPGWTCNMNNVMSFFQHIRHVASLDFLPSGGNLCLRYNISVYNVPEL